MTNPWGIADGYHDAFGEWRVPTPATRAALLRAMGAEGEAPPPATVIVRRAGERIEVPGPARLVLEDGAALDFDGTLPVDIPPGYHELRPGDDGPPIRLIVSPGRCPVPSRRGWGWAAQLYATRSSHSWGIGDLADLRALGRWAAGLGASTILINPLSAALPLRTQQSSPYYPSSRRFVNPLYLRIEDLPGAATLGAELQRLAALGRALGGGRGLRALDSRMRYKPPGLRDLLRAGRALRRRLARVPVGAPPARLAGRRAIRGDARRARALSPVAAVAPRAAVRGRRGRDRNHAGPADRRRPRRGRRLGLAGRAGHRRLGRRRARSLRAPRPGLGTSAVRPTSFARARLRTVHRDDPRLAPPRRRPAHRPRHGTLPSLLDPPRAAAGRGRLCALSRPGIAGHRRAGESARGRDGGRRGSRHGRGRRARGACRARRPLVPRGMVRGAPARELSAAGDGGGDDSRSADDRRALDGRGPR